MIGLPTRYVVYINEVKKENSIMVIDDFDDSDAKYIFDNYNCDKLIVVENDIVVKELSKDEFELSKLNKLCDKIHKEFKDSKLRNYFSLENICNKNNIMIDDYLYLQGYNNYSEYKDDLKNLPIKELSINEILSKIPKSIKEYLDYSIEEIKEESKKNNSLCDSQNNLVYADNEICYYDCHDGDYVFIDTQEAMGLKEETEYSYLKDQILYVSGLSENLLQVDANKTLYNEICIKYNLYDCIKENCYIDENFKKDIDDVQEINDYKILTNCNDYQTLKENLSEEKLKKIEKCLESFQYYESIYDDGDNDIIGDYKRKYGNDYIIDWYEGLMKTNEFIESQKCDVENEMLEEI